MEPRAHLKTGLSRYCLGINFEVSAEGEASHPPSVSGASMYTNVVGGGEVLSAFEIVFGIKTRRPAISVIVRYEPVEEGLSERFSESASSRVVAGDVVTDEESSDFSDLAGDASPYKEGSPQCSELPHVQTSVSVAIVSKSLPSFFVAIQSSLHQINF